LRYSSDFIEQVREANNIVDVIGQYTQLKGRGHQYVGLCPFPDHNEKSPSFSVSESKQLYHCFGCKKSGNLFTFLESFSSLSFTDAVEFLARRAGIPMPVTEEEEKNKSNKSVLYRINKFAAAFFHRQLKILPSDHEVRKYLDKRGISEETIDEMKLGYASDAWESLVEFFKEKQVPLHEAQSLGLIKPKKQRDYFDLFRHRLMFPIFSAQDEVVGFGGRVLDPEQKPKYLNSPESPVFIKGKTFYGLNLTGKHIRQKDCAVIVEGYMDFIALYSAGFQNVVATLGTALTEDHVRLVKKYTSRVVLMFDGDFAGLQAAERSLIPVFEQGLCPLAVFLPDGLDPDDYIKKYGVEKLQKLVDEAPELFILTLQSLLKDFKFTTHEKMEIMSQVKPLLLAINDNALRDLYIKEVSVRLSVEEKWVIKLLKEETKIPPRPTPRAAPLADPAKSEEPLLKKTLKGAPKEELYLLGMGLNSAELLDKVISSGVIEEFSSQDVKSLLSEVIVRHGQNPNDFDKLAPLVVSLVKDPEELTGLFKFWSADGTDDEAIKATASCIKRVQERHLKRQVEIITGQLRNESKESNPEKLEQIMNIQKNRIQLSRQIKGEP
jgi:DNA primase